MKKLTAIILGILLSVGVAGQSGDRVQLKNGSIINGKIIKLVPDGDVTILDKAGNTWVFPMTDVKEITEATEDKPVESIQENTASSFMSPKWINMTSLGFLAGSQTNQYMVSAAPFNMHTSFGYLHNVRLYTGILSGIEFINNYNAPINHIPLMVDIQYFLGDEEVTPVVILRGGYALPSKAKTDDANYEYTYSGGICGSAGMGLKIKSKDKFGWDLSIMYRYMQINYTQTYEWNDQTNIYKDVYNRLELRFGIYLEL